MKRLFAAMGLALVLALFASNAPASGQTSVNTTVTLVGSDVVVVVNGKEIARVPAPVKTVKVEVPTPVVVPSQVPGPVRTVVVQSPVPGPTRTIIVERGRESVVFLPSSPQPVNSPGGQSATPRATLDPTPQPTPSPTVIEREVPGERVTVTRIQAAGISAGLILLGALLAAAIYFIGRSQQRSRDREVEVEGLKSLRDDILE